MASSPVHLLLLLLLFLLSISFLAAGQSPSPSSPPSPAALPDPVAILTKPGNFSILLDLLSKTGLVEPLLSQVNSSKGISFFAPTNDAFAKISATLAKLSDANKMAILMYHALLQYVSVGELDTIGNPVDTYAEGLTLDFNGGDVSTGVVTTKVGTPLYDEFPLGIFPVEDVLIPPTFAMAPAAAPKASAPSAAGMNAPPPQSAASLGRVGWAAVGGAVVAFMSLF